MDRLHLRKVEREDELRLRLLERQESYRLRLVTIEAARFLVVGFSCGLLFAGFWILIVGLM